MINNSYRFLVLIFVLQLSVASAQEAPHLNYSMSPVSGTDNNVNKPFAASYECPLRVQNPMSVLVASFPVVLVAIQQAHQLGLVEAQRQKYVEAELEKYLALLKAPKVVK